MEDFRPADFFMKTLSLYFVSCWLFHKICLFLQRDQNPVAGCLIKTG